MPNLANPVLMELSLTTFQELNHRYWHHPNCPKQSKNKRPDICRNWTMKQKLVNPASLTHSKQQSVISKCLLQSSIVNISPTLLFLPKKAAFHGTLAPCMLFHGKEWFVDPHMGIIIWMNLKYPILCWPSKPRSQPWKYGRFP